MPSISVPRDSRLPASAGDLFDFDSAEDSAADPGSPLRADGYLRPDVGSPAWPVDEARLLAWADAALDCAGRQEALLSRAGARAVATVRAAGATRRSAAAMLATTAAT